ncbi:MAG: T9SS type A sorting domain-containing protein [bacterium]|nr:T9SS type A sorting domain-containing protein [bacterium]
MRKVNLSLYVLLVLSLLMGGSLLAQPACVDIDGSGEASIMDVAIFLDGMYVTGNLDSAHAATAAGLDGYEGVTSHDLMWLIGWLYIDMDMQPACNTNLGWDYPASDDTLKYGDLFVPAGEDTCTVDVLVHALDQFHTLSMAFEYGLGGDDIDYVGAEWLMSADLDEFESHDPDANLLSLAMLSIFSAQLSGGCGEPQYSYTPVVQLTFVVTPSTEDRTITITPTDWLRNNSRHTTVLSRFDQDQHDFAGRQPVILTYADNPDEDAHGNFCFGGFRGNVDGSWDEVVDITDLQVLVDFQYISLQEPFALGEADVAPLTGADGVLDISDVSALVDHLFLTLTDLPTCEECAAAKRLPRVAGSIQTVHQDGTTRLTVTSSEELRGLHLVIRGDDVQPAAYSPLGGTMDLMVGQRDGDVIVGLIDLDGPGTIPIGDCEVLELIGTYEVVAASGASLDHVTVALNRGTGDNLPHAFGLDQNYPNPFNPETEIGFSVPASSRVQLTIYNALGQRVKTLVDDVMNAGPARVTWDGTDRAGNGVASGVYFYRLTIGENTDAKKMLLLK